MQHGYHPLTPITASQPIDHIAIDTATSFPTSSTGNNVLLVIVCVFTRFVFLRAMPDKSAASVAANLFSIFVDFGFPRVIQSDNGSEFVNQLVEYLTKHTGIDHRLVNTSLSSRKRPRGEVRSDIDQSRPQVSGRRN